MGRPLATDEEIHRALALSGALEFVQKQKNGLNYTISEGGCGLSGASGKALLLARTLILQPQILLLDEPTASLDEVSEQQLIQQLGPWLGNRTLVVATHRIPILQLVNRIIVLDNGRIVMDGPRDQILQQHGLMEKKSAPRRTATLKPADSTEARV